MVAVPARVSADFVVQDDRGFKANVRATGYIPDVSADSSLVSAVYTRIAAIGTALAACTNAKIVQSGMSWEWSIAQEPATESGTYELVIQKARLNWGDGTVLRSHTSVPAPVDALFLAASSENLIVVNPASTQLTGLQTAINAFLVSPAGEGIASQFFGGQLVQGKPRRRRVLQGA